MKIPFNHHFPMVCLFVGVPPFFTIVAVQQSWRSTRLPGPPDLDPSRTPDATKKLKTAISSHHENVFFVDPYVYYIYICIIYIYIYTIVYVCIHTHIYMYMCAISIPHQSHEITIFPSSAAKPRAQVSNFS